MKAEVVGKVDQAAIVDESFAVAFPNHRRLHPVAKDLARHPADRRERQAMTAQDLWKVLVHDVACPDQAAAAEHHGKQPDDPRQGRLVGEHDVELGEIYLGLLARRVSKRSSKPACSGGRTSRRKSVTAV